MRLVERDEDPEAFADFREIIKDLKGSITKQTKEGRSGLDVFKIKFKQLSYPVHLFAVEEDDNDFFGFWKIDNSKYAKELKAKDTVAGRDSVYSYADGDELGGTLDRMGKNQ